MLYFNQKNYLPIILICTVGVAFIFRLSECLMDNHNVWEPIKERKTPNEGIHRSLRNGLWFGLTAIVHFGILFGIGVTLIGWGFGKFLTFGTDFWLLCWLYLTFYSGLFFGVLHGGFAALQHYVLRFLLWRNGFAPLRYVRFLNYAASLLFLRKVGGGYIFVHRMVLEYFAALDEP